MKSFKDNAGRDWTIAVNIETVRQVRARLNIDMLDPSVFSVFSDPVKLVDVIYVLCSEQASLKSVSDADFGRAMCGDAIELAANALVSEIADFSPRRREVMEAAIDKIRAIEAKAIKMAVEKINSPEMDALLEKELGAPLGNSLASSE